MRNFLISQRGCRCACPETSHSQISHPHPGSSWPFSLLHPLPHSLSHACSTSHLTYILSTHNRVSSTGSPHPDGTLNNTVRIKIRHYRQLGLLIDSEIVLSTSYGKTRVFINKTLSTETAYQQDLINRDLLSTRLIVGKVGPGMWCVNCNSTSG